MRLFTPTLLAMTVVSSGPLLAQTAGDTLPSCNAWLENSVKGRTLSVDPKALERLKAAGVRIEPERRMGGAGYPWEHSIQVALPASYGKGDRQYPVLWVMDGMFFFSTVTELVTSCAGKTMPEMIVVAVGPPPGTERNEMARRRNFDFSPNAIQGYQGFGSSVHNERVEAAIKKAQAEGKPVNDSLGGAPRFLPFLVDEVRGELARDYRLSDDHTLFGHSGGGLFCAYALVARPASFKRYVCGSPSLAAGDYDVFRLEERYAQHNKDLAAAVFFAAGEAEVLANTWGIVSSTARMAEILSTRGYPSLKLNARIFPGENHVSVIPLVLAWGLRAVWDKDFTP